MLSSKSSLDKFSKAFFPSSDLISSFKVSSFLFNLSKNLFISLLVSISFNSFLPSSRSFFSFSFSSLDKSSVFSMFFFSFSTLFIISLFPFSKFLNSLAFVFEVEGTNKIPVHITIKTPILKSFFLSIFIGNFSL